METSIFNATTGKNFFTEKRVKSIFSFPHTHTITVPEIILGENGAIIRVSLRDIWDNNLWLNKEETSISPAKTSYDIKLEKMIRFESEFSQLFSF